MSCKDSLGVEGFLGETEAHSFFDAMKKEPLQ